jgi:Mn-dependent DtxR family transcriptional regulator
MCINALTFVRIHTLPKKPGFMAHQKTIVDFQTGEIKEVNSGFVQFYEDNMPLLIKMINENPTALKILLWLITHMEGFGSLVASQTAICEALNIHRNTLSNAINYLKDKKAISVLKSGTTNVYAVNEQIAWKETASLKKFAHFSAKVYLVPTEQEEDYQRSMFAHAIKKPTKTRNQKLRTSKPSEFAT